jgi:hypothetical protein
MSRNISHTHFYYCLQWHFSSIRSGWACRLPGFSSFADIEQASSHGLSCREAWLLVDPVYFVIVAE